jgi:GT2 family glycosyltransferase
VEQAHPFFSIIILCWNSNQTLKLCLDAINSQTDHDFEVLVIDNGSSEPLPGGLAAAYPQLPIQERTLEQNIGFAGGNNLAAGMAHGDYLVLLNADAFPKPDWLENIREAIHKYPHYFFASKLIMANQPERMDGMGDVYHISGLAWRNAHNMLVSDVRDEEIEVFSACAAAAVYPIEAFQKVKGFDEDYFSYQEDIDLSFRLRLMGYKCIYLPEAVVLHVGSGSTSRRSDLSVYYGHRNLVWTFIKDVPGIWVWLLAPLHLAVNLFMILVGISRQQGRVMLKAKKDALRGIPSMWKKRAQVQGTRTVPIHRLLLAMDWNPVSPLTKLFLK